MVKSFSRRMFLGGAASFFGTAAGANAPTLSLRPVLRPDTLEHAALNDPAALVQGAGLSGELGFAVAELNTGKILESHNGSNELPPASVAKTLTTLYALKTLGPTHQFVTTLVTTGTVTNGVLGGDLTLVGGGDPTLDTNALAQMARQLKAQGIREVKGRFQVYGGALPRIDTIDPEQPDSAGYSPAISGLALNFNRVHFEWKRTGAGYAIAMDARSDRYWPDVAVATMKVVTRQMPVYTYQQENGVDHWTVASGALGKGGARWLPVRQPELYAGDVFRTLARSHGIVLSKAQIVENHPAGRVLVRNNSPALQEILRDMLKYSTNITAEMIGLATTKARGGGAATLAQSGQEMSRWAEQSLAMPGVNMVDHSGLGGASRIMPEALASMLAHAQHHTVLKPLLKQITLRKSDGKPDKTHPIEVFAKTGTLNFVSGLAGYMRHPDGRELAFAIFATDSQARDKIKRADRIRPKGARSWNRRAKKFQQSLIERWGALYGA